jgi:mono/diheme cytochrome c family protein
MEAFKMRKRPVHRAWAQAFTLTIATIGSATAVYAQTTEFGEHEYHRSCAACHGRSGKGDGPVSKVLKIAPSDLTRLSGSNKGVFPVSRVYDAIDGKAEVLAHGERDMPVWGETYKRELMYPGSTLSPEVMASIVRGRILALIEYISTLQGK